MVSCTPPYQMFAECSHASATDNATAEHSAPCLPGGCPGAIERHYYDLGGPGGFLGEPLTGELTAPDGVGRFTHYDSCSIYWTPPTDAREVHGRIRDLWAGLGWERGFLGYPVTDETPTPDGIGRYNHFRGGSLYWSPATDAHEVHGGVLQTWAGLGWERGVLGYLLTDETPTPDGVGRYNHFQGGWVYWSPVSGAHEVHGGIRQAWAGIGWERGPLGYPVTDEHDIAGGRASGFEHGRISWNDSTGATTVSYA